MKICLLVCRVNKAFLLLLLLFLILAVHLFFAWKLRSQILYERHLSFLWTLTKAGKRWDRQSTFSGRGSNHKASRDQSFANHSDAKVLSRDQNFWAAVREAGRKKKLVSGRRRWIVTSLNGLRVALKSTQDECATHLRKENILSNLQLHNFFFDRWFSRTILYIFMLPHIPRILSLGHLWLMRRFHVRP